MEAIRGENSTETLKEKLKLEIKDPKLQTDRLSHMPC
jgi:hypothetical protein